MTTPHALCLGEVICTADSTLGTDMRVQLCVDAHILLPGAPSWFPAFHA